MEKTPNHLSYQSSHLSADWQLGGGDHPIATASGDPPATLTNQITGTSPCPSISMADSFCPALWNSHPPNPQSSGFCEPNFSTTMTSSGALPHGGVSPFPSDSGFIERAARFSCFDGTNYSRMVNPFGTPEPPLSPYSNASKAAGVSGNESGEPEFSCGAGAGAGDSSSQELGAKKRKRSNQEMGLEKAEAVKESVESKQKAEQNSSRMAAAKGSGKQVKDNSDSPKDDCVHMRARSGQATNSHSLAERVRREKISERMKFLQELVPGCSKVTGKAVMLDEIINYVQSLQRQVEFLSMKLAAVNPRLDLSIEALISKDFLQSRGFSSSTMGFSHDMMHPQLHLPQQSLIQAGMPGITHPSDALRRAINAQLSMINGYKEPALQIPGTWDDELHNAIQMNFGTNNPPLNSEELGDKTRDGFTI